MKRAEIQEQIADLQSKLDIMNRVPSDTFPFGTVVVFSAASGSKWHYLKTGEETWLNLQVNTAKDLASWILTAVESNVGYFEVYELKVQPTPFFASA
ncbi:MAG: hypothetical protein HMLIMOIP_002060 [Candidatus Nitrosomirales archaeon]|jgi:hypothetical protein